MGKTMTAESMSKDERSCLVYIECCCVDHGGMLAGARMNDADHEAIAKFREAGLVLSGRIPHSQLSRRNGSGGIQNTHWAVLTAAGWELAAQLRRLRAEQRGPIATGVFDELRDRGIECDVNNPTPTQERDDG